MNRHEGSRVIRTAAVIGVLALGTLSACDDDPDAVRGSGTIVSESRSVDGFREISVEGSGRLTVDVGAEESLEVEADDNLLPLIRTDVRGSTLVIDLAEPISPSQQIAFTVGAIDFDGVSVAGSADVIAPNLDCAEFRVAVAGSSDLELGGTCDSLEVSITGSAELDAADLVVATAAIDIAGSADGVVHATDQLRVSIAGSGQIEYVGDPATDIDIRGSGDVRRVSS